MLKEFIEEVLSKLPKSETGDGNFVCGHEIITSTEPMDISSAHETICEPEKLIETHINQLKSLIEKHKDKQCFVRIMPEVFRKSNRAEGYYSRLQFK